MEENTGKRNKAETICLGGIAVLGFLLLAQVHDMMDWSSGGWLWMTLMMIGGAVLIVVVVFLLLRGTSGGTGFGSGNTPRESPLDIAKRRYAAGEITPEEFEKIKKDIGGAEADGKQR